VEEVPGAGKSPSHRSAGRNGGYHHDKTALQQAPPEFMYNVNLGGRGGGPYAMIRKEWYAYDYYNNTTANWDKGNCVRVYF